MKSLTWLNSNCQPSQFGASLFEPNAFPATNFERDIDREVVEMTQKRKEIFEKYNSISRELKDNDMNKGYRYVLLKGNNHQLIQRVMDKRASWVQASPAATLFEFKWAPLS